MTVSPMTNSMLSAAGDHRRYSAQHLCDLLRPSTLGGDFVNEIINLSFGGIKVHVIETGPISSCINCFLTFHCV